MKQTIIAIISIFLTTAVVGQVENITITNDSSIVVDKAYAGVLTTTSFNTSKLQTTSDVNIRLGAMATWKLNKKVSIRGFGAWDRTSAGQTDISAFWISYKPSTNVQITVGKAPTIGALLHRPNPVTGDGHFEASTPAQATGSLPTITMKVGTSSRHWMVGINAIGSNAMTQIGGTYGAVTLSASYNHGTHKAAAYTTVTKGRVKTTFAWKQDDIVSDLFIFTINNPKQVYFYSDFGYKYKIGKWSSTEYGVLKLFSGKVKGIIGVAHNPLNNALKGYAFVYL
ncbi:hypothetical protein KA478_01505 [Patescibacteria group bacterium]|nr:hypothetical protein [Patescibacteria group bacterium]